MKYKALLENNDIFIDFIEAIFNENYICVENLEYKKCFKNIVTKDYLIELLEEGNNYKQITCITGKSLITIKREFKKFNIDYESYISKRGKK